MCKRHVVRDSRQPDMCHAGALTMAYYTIEGVIHCQEIMTRIQEFYLLMMVEQPPINFGTSCVQAYHIRQVHETVNALKPSETN